MKPQFRSLALALVMTTAAMAQRGFGPHAATAPDPAARVQNQVTRLTTLLNLTTAQASQATTIFTAAQSSVDTLEATLRTDRDSLATAVKTNATSTIDQLASMIGTINGQITAAQSKADAAFYAILTADQQAKWDQLGGLPGFGRGPGGPPPRP